MGIDEFNFETDYDLFLYYKELYGDLIYKTGIYKFYFIERPEYFYVGMAGVVNKTPCKCGFYSRWKRHLGDLKKNIHKNTFIQNMYNSYGFNSLRFEFLEFCDSELCSINEIKWFEILHPPTNFQGNKKFKKAECLPDGIKNRVYRTGFTHSDETKLKMAKAQIGRVYVRNRIEKYILQDIINKVNIGDPIDKLSRKYHHALSDVYKDIEFHFGKDVLINVKLKSKEINGDKIRKRNISRTEDKNEKHKDIIPIIIDKYKEGLLIKEIRPFVNINEDLIGILIKMNMSKEEIKKIKSVNAVRK